MSNNIIKRLIDSLKKVDKQPEPNRNIDTTIDADKSFEPLTPSKISTILYNNDMSQKAWLWEYIVSREPIIQACMQTRILSVIGKPYEIISASDNESDNLIAKEVSDIFDNLDDWHNIQFDMLNSIGTGVALHKINWDLVKGKITPISLDYVPSQSLSWKTNETTQKIELYYKDIEYKYINVNEFSDWFMVKYYKNQTANVSRQGLLYALSWYYYIKRNAITSWQIAAELFGVPIRWGTYANDTPDEDRRELKRGLATMGKSAWAMIHETAKIELLEPNSRGDISQMYMSMINDFVNNEMAIMILGQSATTFGTAGNLGNETTRDKVRQDILAADVIGLQLTINKLIEKYVRLNYGANVKPPKYVINYEEQEDMKMKAEMIKILADAGYPAPKDWVYNTFGIPYDETETSE